MEISLQYGLKITSFKPAPKAPLPPGPPTVPFPPLEHRTPQVVMDTSGNATAIWVEHGTVHAASKPLTGSWSSPTTISGTTATSPDLAVDSSGDIAAVWAENGAIKAAIKPFASAWGPSVRIGSSGNNPHLEMGGTGSNRTVAAVWHTLANGTNLINASSALVAHGVWTPAVTISDIHQQAGNARVAVDGEGNATAIWFQYQSAGDVFWNVNVQTANLLSNNTWSTPVTLSAPGVRDPANLVARVGFDGLGNKIALWNNSYDGSTFDIESAVCPVRGVWSPSTALVNSNTYAYKTQLAVTEVGTALAVYMFSNGVENLIQSSETDFSGFMQTVWSVPANISAGNESGYPQVTAVVMGDAINTAALWVNYNGTTEQVVASTGSKTLTTPPSDLAVTQTSINFGIFTEYKNTVTWVASTDLNVTGYAIYRNGTFIAQVPVTSLEYVDDNATHGGAVTYGVAAISQGTSLSQIISVNYP